MNLARVAQRLGITESSPLPPLDQLDFFIGGVAGLALSGTYLSDLFGAAVLTFAVHLTSNAIGYRMGLKDVWW